MRTAILAILLMISFSEVYSQGKKKKKVKWQDWSDSIAFFSGPEPLVTGKGFYSDSLSMAYDGKMFFEVEGEYFIINSVADYYLWFVNKYPYLFKTSIDNYRFYYVERDNYNMAKFITYNYSGRKIPLKFVQINDGFAQPVNNKTMRDARGDNAGITDMSSEVAKAYKSSSTPAPKPKVTAPKKRN